MGKITQFEDLNCWKNARILVSDIYQTSNSDRFRSDYALKDQIRRAVISIMNNIAEGFSRYHKNDKIRFLDFAQSSAAEVRSLLYLAEDLDYISNEHAKSLREDALTCQKLILGFIRHLNNHTKTL